MIWSCGSFSHKIIATLTTFESITCTHYCMSTVRMSLAVEMPLYIVSVYRAWMQWIILSEMAGRTKIIYILEANVNRLPSELFSSGVSAYLLNTPLPPAHPLSITLPILISFIVCVSICHSLTHWFGLFWFVCLFFRMYVSWGERPYLHHSFSPRNLSISQSLFSINIYSNNEWMDGWMN